MTYWCVVQTHVRSEDEAAFHLKCQGYKVFLPKHLKRRKHARRTDWVSTPIFPRYLFVSIDPDSSPWWTIRSTVGVSYLLCFGETPAIVPAKVIAEIKARQDEKGMVRLNTVCSFKRGDRIKIIDGPLSNLEGLCECPADEDRVAVLLNLMGREVKARVPLETVYACG